LGENITNINNAAYNINVIHLSESIDIEKKKILRKLTLHNQVHNHGLELDKYLNNLKLLNEEIRRINTLNLSLNKTELNIKPSTSPLKIYKNIEN
jgi:hypothetical protein